MQGDRPAPGTPLTGEGGVLPRFSPSQITPRTVVVVLLTGLLLLGGLWLLWQLQQILRWLVIALFLAVALNPAVNWLDRRLPGGRGIAILLVYLVLLLVLAGMGALIVPPLVAQAQGLSGYVVDLFQQPGGVNQAISEFASRYGLEGYLDVIRDQLSTLPGRLVTAAGPLLNVTRGVFGSITAFISILLLTFFMLRDGERFAEAVVRLFSTAQQPRLHRLLGQAAGAVQGYITGNLVISLIAGVCAFAVLTVLRVPYGVVLALVVALFDLIPLVGATLGAAIVVIVALFIDPTKGVILAVYFLIYQQIENNVLQPWVYGRSVSLHPLAVTVAVLAGGQLLGILGALLAIPIAEIIRILIAEWLATRAQATGGVVHSTEAGPPVEQAVADAAGPAGPAGSTA